MLTRQQIDRYGDELYDAWVGRFSVAPLVEREPDITLDEAYLVQARVIERRLAAGERVVGKKIGVTSRAVQDMLQVFEPDFGQLTSGMVRREGDVVHLGELVAPRAEAELAFVLKRDLAGPGVTAADVIRATERVAPCFEIVDSRIRDWKIRIQDTVADNASCGVFVVGEASADPRDLDLALAGMVLEVNGELAATSAGAAVQGHPANAVAWLANTLGRLGIPFRAGEVILSGSQSPLLKIADGDAMVCTVGGLGSCRVRFAESSASGRSAT